MAYRIMTAITSFPTRTITAEPNFNYSYEDELTAFVGAMPQSKQVQVGSDGYTESATVDFIGGAVSPGISTGGAFRRAVAGLVLTATGFRPNTDVDVKGFGPSGEEASVATADSSGRVGIGARLLTYTDEDLQEGKEVAGGTVTVTSRNNASAYIAPFPHPLYNEPLFLGYDTSQLQYRRYRPRGADRDSSITAFRPGAYKTFSESVNVGAGIENHPTTEEQDLPGKVACPKSFYLNFNINFKERRGRNAKIHNGDAAVIWPGRPGGLKVLLKGFTPRSYKSQLKQPAAYVIESSSGKLVSVGRYSYGQYEYAVRDGESLIISSASFGSRPEARPMYYVPASNPQAATAVFNYGDDVKDFFDITTRPYFRRAEFGFARWLKAYEPGILKIRVTV